MSQSTQTAQAVHSAAVVATRTSHRSPHPLVKVSLAGWAVVPPAESMT